MSKTAKQRPKKPMAVAGRQEWHIKPVTKVIPNKKKAKPDRKEKHKGRLFSRSASSSETGSNEAA